MTRQLRPPGPVWEHRDSLLWPGPGGPIRGSGVGSVSARGGLDQPCRCSPHVPTCTGPAPRLFYSGSRRAAYDLACTRLAPELAANEHCSRDEWPLIGVTKHEDLRSFSQVLSY